MGAPAVRVRVSIVRMRVSIMRVRLSIMRVRLSIVRVRLSIVRVRLSIVRVRVCVMRMCVSVMRMCVPVMRVGVFTARTAMCYRQGRAKPLDKQAESYANNYGAGDQAKNRKQPLRQYVLRRKQGYQPEPEHPCRMGYGNGQSQEGGVPGSPSRSYQVGSHDGLAVARRQSVKSAEPRGEKQA